MLSAEEGTKVGRLVTVQVQGNILSFPSEKIATNQEGGLGEDAREINDRSNCSRRQAGKRASAASPFSSALPKAKFELNLIQYPPSHLAQIIQLNPNGYLGRSQQLQILVG
jgi:hypothetical protein